jgi:HD domain-containing protein
MRGVLGVVTLALMAAVVVKATGGSPNALTHLGYLSVILAAYLFGWPGAVSAGLLVGAFLGPLASATGMPNDGPQAWLTRSLAFVGIGAALGLLFDRMRSAVMATERRTIRLVEQEQAAIVAFARAAEAKDEATGEHVVRVQVTSEALARASGLDAADAERIGWAAMLHDVGKLHVPDRILLKPGPLDAEEWAIMRQHPVWGERILGDDAGFATARLIARWHHENLDGTGYPDGLAGARIPLEARIVRITDAFDAMTNRRPYCATLPFEEALAELDRWAGQQFDPELVATMIELIRNDQAVRGALDRLAGRAGHSE